MARDKDPYSRARRLGTLLPTLGPDAVPAVRQTLDDPMLDLRGAELELLLRFWATHQPYEASLWANEERFGELSRGSRLRRAQSLGGSRPEGCRRRDVEMGGRSTTISRSSCRSRWCAAGTRTATSPGSGSSCAGLPVSVPGQRGVTTYIRLMMENEGSAAVTSWAESLPDDEDKTFKLTVFRRVVNVLAQLDPPAATRWCELHCDGPYGNNMRSLIARNWALRDGPAALAWLSTAPEGHEKNLAIRVTFAHWAEMDREAAMAWMASQTAGEPAPWLRPIYPVYARLLSGESPNDAIQWANAIENEREREHVLIGVVRVWRQLDEAAAESWLAQSSALGRGAGEGTGARQEEGPAARLMPGRL